MTNDTCPVCGKGEWEDYAEIGPPYGHRVSHLDCVRNQQKVIDNQAAALYKLATEKGWRQRAEQAEAEAERLRWMLREVEAGATVDAAATRYQREQM